MRGDDMKDFLPEIYYRVVVHAPKERGWKYLDPRSKSFTDSNYARVYVKTAERAGLTAKLYFTATSWQEAEVDYQYAGR
jgi:hypothetical protein